MGVSGSGKSTIASMLAARLGYTYVDGDWLHPESNVEKMRSGVPLTDEDRWPWLEAIAARAQRLRGEGTGAVIACSALRRAYREILMAKDARLVYLEGDRDTVARRLGSRDGHFMPPALLESQFAALEPPSPEENPIVVSIARAPEEIVGEIIGAL